MLHILEDMGWSWSGSCLSMELSWLGGHIQYLNAKDCSKRKRNCQLLTREGLFQKGNIVVCVSWGCLWNVWDWISYRGLLCKVPTSKNIIHFQNYDDMFCILIWINQVFILTFILKFFNSCHILLHYSVVTSRRQMYLSTRNTFKIYIRRNSHE